MSYPIITGFCSVFIGVREQVYMNMTIHRILTLVKNRNFEILVNQARQYFNYDEEKYSRMKKQLPSFTPAATFNRIRNNERIRSLSRLVILDFDNLSNVESAKKIVSLEPCTLACFKSPSGQGLKILILTNANSKEEYSEAYQMAASYFYQILKEGLDPADDLTRLCFLSSDRDLYWNPRAWTIEQQKNFF